MPLAGPPVGPSGAEDPEYLLVSPCLPVCPLGLAPSDVLTQIDKFSENAT